jgi:glycosyl transferase family 25
MEKGCVMKVKVISLSCSAPNIKSVCFDFFKAIDNINNISEFSFDESLFKLVYGRDVRNGEKGCSLSHFEVISDFSLNSGDDFLTVLEDDAVLLEEFEAVISGISELDTSVPLIVVIGLSKVKRSTFWIQELKWPLRNKLSIGGVVFGQGINNYFGTVGYVINKAAAQIIANQRHIFWVADDWRIISNMGISVFYTNTPVVLEDFNTNSSTGNKIVCLNSFRDNFMNNFILILKGCRERLRILLRKID